MRLRAWNAARLERIGLVDRIRQPAGLGRGPVDGLIGKLDGVGLDGGDRGRNERSPAARRPGDQRLHRDGGGRRQHLGRRRVRRGRTGRNQPRHPFEQRRGVGRDTGRLGKPRGIVGGQPVDHGQARVDGRAVLGVDPPVDRRGEDDAAALLQANEGVSPGRMVGRASRAGDRDEPAADGEAGQGRADMAQGRVLHRAVDVQGGRERRVHQHDGRRHGGVQVVVDVRGVVAGDGNILEQLGEQRRAALGQLIERQLGARLLGVNSQQARAGRRLEHEIARPQRRRNGGDEGEPRRGAELLQRLAGFGAAGVGREKRRDLLDHREPRGRRSGFAENRRSVFALEQHLRRLASVAGGLPVPGAFGVGTAEGALHHCTQGARIDGAAAFEVGEQGARGGEDRLGGRGKAGSHRKRGGGR